MEDVRPHPRESLPLLDPEAVLLVDDGDGEIGEDHVPLDQRMRADCDLRRSRLDLGARLLCARAPGQEQGPHPELRADPLDREEMLLRERLGRRHQRALTPGLDGPKKGVERDRGLAGADVPLEQPLHRSRLRQVGVDLRDGALLILGQRERQRRPVARDQLAGRTERPSGLALDPGAKHRELQRHELVEREPLACGLSLVEVGGEVHRPERIATRGPLLLDRERVEHIVRVQLERRARRARAAWLRRDLLARAVDRRKIGGPPSPRRDRRSGPRNRAVRAVRAAARTSRASTGLRARAG